MGRKACAVILSLLLLVACGREGPIGRRPSVPADAPTIAPIALPPPAERDARPVVWTASNGPVAMRIVMTPRRPVVGDLVRFDIKMSYGQPPYRPGFFAYELSIEEGWGESAAAGCGGPPPGVKRRPPRPFDDNMHRELRVYRPGSHSFSLDAHPGCLFGAPGVSIKRTYDVVGPRPLAGFHWTGSDGTRQVDVVVAPESTKERRATHYYAIFEDRTGAPFGWRITFGDGRRAVVGGPACKPEAARSDGRYVRHFSRTYKHPAEYHVRIELSRTCLSAPRARGRVVVDKVLRARPYVRMFKGGELLPSHRYPPLRKTLLPPVRLAGDNRTGCVWLERVSDGERLPVLWPWGAWRTFELGPLYVFGAGTVSWKGGVVRKNVRILGTQDAGSIPERCRFGEVALLLAPIPAAPPTGR